MISMVKSECLEPGCHVTTDKRYCIQHIKGAKAKGFRKGSDPAPYKSKEWKAARKICLTRQPICQGFLRVCSNKSVHADHIIKWKEFKGSFFDQKNLQGLCHSCHSRKTGKGL